MEKKQYDSVKIADGFGLVLFGHSPLSRIQKAPEEALEVISRNLSDQLNTAIAALAVAIGNQAGAVNDVSATEDGS